MKRAQKDSLDGQRSEWEEHWSDVDENKLVASVDEAANSTEKQQFPCDVCQKVFKTNAAWTRHRISHFTGYTCDQCKKSFSRKENLTRHMKNKHHNLSTRHRSNVVCNHCGKRFSRPCFLQRHCKQKHGESVEQKSNRFPCKYCRIPFSTYADLFEHVDQTHTPHRGLTSQSGGQKSSSSSSEKELTDSPQFKKARYTTTDEHTDPSIEGISDPPVTLEEPLSGDVEETALARGIYNKHIYPKKGERYDLLVFLASVKSTMREVLEQRVQETNGIKWNISVQVEMEKDMGDGTVTTSSPHFRSRTYILLNTDTLESHNINESMQKMHSSMEAYIREGSGWYLKEVLKLVIHTIIYMPLSGSTFIPLPKSLAHGHGVLNIQNLDNKCFLYCVLASLHPANQTAPEVEHYLPYEEELNMNGIQYPVILPQIEKFERQNENISVNVFGYEDKDILPLRITPRPHRLHHVNLLWLKSGEKAHYCLITDLNGFLSRTKTHRNQMFFCSYCLHGFRKNESLEKHIPYCSIHGAQKIELPIEGFDDHLEFTDFEKTLKVPFVIYADFETLNVKLPSCTPDPRQSSTTHTAKLEPCGFGYKVVCAEEPKYTKPTVVYRGKDASAELIRHLLREMDEIKTILCQVEPMTLTKEDLIETENATTCCLCQHSFTSYYKKHRQIVHHHNHVTGAFIGMAHNHCNLQARQMDFIPVIFHNLKNFDAHILCQHIGEFKQVPLRCIAQNNERYVSFSLGNLRFIDSFQFLPASLESLVDNLSQEGLDAFSHVGSEFPIRDEASLLLRKGVYPYDYMDSETKFGECSLPLQDEFYSQLKREGISETDYSHAQRVWETFNIANMGEYHDLYLRTDVLLLCDVFEAFREMSMNSYQLDPAHFYTSPGLAWSACLKMTRIRLQLLTQIDMQLYVEAALRGGISQISNRYKKSNNPYLQDYDPSEPTSYLMYLDMNNLYGYAMVQKLPVDSFRFLDDREIRFFDIHDESEDDDIGYILEVSLKYPEKLHDWHNDYPLAPERKTIPNEILSPYARELWSKLHGANSEDELPPRPMTEKLLTTLEDKTKYILHYRNLKLYLDLGMEIQEIHRILQFRQEAWMKPFIDFNTEKRKQATSTFAKGLYKLFNVSVFGKTMQNVRKYKDIELVHTERRLKKLSAKATYKSAKIFSEDLVAVELSKRKVKLDKPSYCGMCILDLSKVAMYDFYYNVLKQKYGKKMELQMTDTDSLLFYCETEDIYKDMMNDIDLYDTSDYPQGHFLHSNTNKKKIGRMKDECNGRVISEFVGLRSKMYSFRCSETEEKKAKGVSKLTVERDLRFEHYKQTLFDESQSHSSMIALRSKDHELFCDTIVKTGLSAFDDKRYLLNATSSCAYGHCLVTNFNIRIL